MKETPQDPTASRYEHAAQGLRRSDLDPDPIKQFANWFTAAIEAGIRDVNAMSLATAGHDGTNVAELGIGTNEKAILSGEILEDEKLLGTVHVAFGASAAIGGTVQVPVHLDCLVMKPDVAVDDEPVVRDGALLV